MLTKVCWQTLFTHVIFQQQEIKRDSYSAITLHYCMWL